MVEPAPPAPSAPSRQARQGQKEAQKEDPFFRTATLGDRLIAFALDSTFFSARLPLQTRGPSCAGALSMEWN